MTVTKDGLAAHSRQRTKDVQQRLQAAMKVIEAEIGKNEGIYPFHSGRLSLSEVCRRAGVHKVTVQGKLHRESTKVHIESWLTRVKRELILGHKEVRKVVNRRANDWKSKYEDVANRFNEMYAIEIPAKNALLTAASERIAALEIEVAQLRREVSKGKVVPFSKQKKDK